MSMVSLNPGPLFSTPGLNQTHTPVGPAASQDQIKAMFKGKEYSGRYDWPPDSPVAEVYDIKNTSAKMVILNNRTKPKSASHLRGQTDRVDYRTTTPNPDRHTPDTHPKKNPDRHLACSDSISPRFVRKPRLDNTWVNQNNRSRKTSEGESSISSDGTDRRVSRQPPHGHHGDRYVPLSGRASSAHSGQVSVSPAYFTAPKCGQPKKQRRTPISMHDNTSLTRNMSRGNRAYLHSIAQVYDISKEKQYKQYQYKALVIKEFLKGFHTMEECRKYLRYIDGPRQRPYGATDPNKKAPSHRSNNEHKRSKTPQGHKKICHKGDKKKTSQDEDVDNKEVRRGSTTSASQSDDKVKKQSKNELKEDVERDESIAGDAEQDTSKTYEEDHSNKDKEHSDGDGDDDREIRIKVQVEGARTKQKTLKKESKSATRESKKRKQKGQKQQRETKTEVKHKENARKETEHDDKPDAELAAKDKQQVITKNKHDYQTPVANIRTEKKQSEPSEETPKEESLGLAKLAWSDQKENPTTMNAESSETKATIEGTKDGRKRDSSQDESESDSDSLHLHGPEATIRPKSRLAHRHLVKHKDFKESNENVDDKLVHDAAKSKVLDDASESVNTVESVKQSRTEIITEHISRNDDQVGLESSDPEPKTIITAELEVNSPEQEQPKEDIIDSKQESDMKLALAVTSQHEGLESDSDDDINGNSRQHSTKHEETNNSVMVRNKLTETSDDMMSNKRSKMADERQDDTAEQVEEDEMRGPEHDVNGNDPKPTEQDRPTSSDMSKIDDEQTTHSTDTKSWHSSILDEKVSEKGRRDLTSTNDTEFSDIDRTTNTNVEMQVPETQQVDSKSDAFPVKVVTPVTIPTPPTGDVENSMSKDNTITTSTINAKVDDTLADVHRNTGIDYKYDANVEVSNRNERTIDEPKHEFKLQTPDVDSSESDVYGPGQPVEDPNDNIRIDDMKETSLSETNNYEAHSSDDQSESDSDKEPYLLHGREGTTRPKSRLGNRSLAAKEEIHFTKSGEPDANAYIIPPAEPLFEGEYLTLETDSIDQSGDIQTPANDADKDMHVMDTGVILVDLGNHLKQDSEPVSVTKDERHPDNMQTEVVQHEGDTGEAQDTKRADNKISNDTNIHQSIAEERIGAVDGAISTEHELPSSSDIGGESKSSDTPLATTEHNNSLNLLRSVLEADRSGTPESLQYESDIDKLTKALNVEQEIDLDKITTAQDSTWTNRASQESPVTNYVKELNKTDTTRVQSAQHISMNNGDNNTNMAGLEQTRTRKVSSSSSHTSTSTEEEDALGRANMLS